MGVMISHCYEKGNLLGPHAREAMDLLQWFPGALRTDPALK